MLPRVTEISREALGSGSSVGLGVALALPSGRRPGQRQRHAMNMNSVATVGQMQPNLIHIVFDNKVCRPRAASAPTSFNADLVAVARPHQTRRVTRPRRSRASARRIPERPAFHRLRPSS
jgi:hypothetical protein